MRQKQDGGERSTNYQAGRDVTTNVTYVTNIHGVTEERAREIAVIASREVVLREGREVAAAVITERVDHITDLVFEGINERDTSLFNRFEDPRFLAALTDSQRSYAETGDNDLAEILARLVVGLAAKPIRSMHEIVLRQAIIVAPQLTSAHLRALAVNMFLTRFRFNFPHSVETLLDALDHQLRPYYGGLPKSPVDYSYMSSIGVGSHMEGLQSLGNKPYQLLHKKYPNAMYPAFSAEDIQETGLADDQASMDMLAVLADTPDAVTQTEQGTVVAKDKAHFRIAQDHADAILRGNENALTLPQKAFRKLVGERSINAEQLREKIVESKPELAEFLQNLETTNAFDLQLNPVGMLLARHEMGDKAPDLAKQIDAAFDEF